MLAPTSCFSPSSFWILGFFSANTASSEQPSGRDGTKRPIFVVLQIIRSNSAAKRRLVAGESAVSKKYCPLERSSPAASILVRRAGSPDNLHSLIFPANKTISVCHRACMIERILTNGLTAAIYKAVISSIRSLRNNMGLPMRSPACLKNSFYSRNSAAVSTARIS